MNQGNNSYLSLPSGFTVDASFVLNFILLDEPTRALTDAVFKKFKQGDVGLLSSPLLYCEVGNILNTAFKQKRLKGDLLFKLYEKFLNLGIRVIEVDHRGVLKLAVARGIIFYDASYVYISTLTHSPLLGYDEQLLTLIK